jgi:hypothetical protein
VARIAVAAAVVVLVGMFAAVAASVVHVRDPLDQQASKSFDATVFGDARKPVLQPRGCTKERVDVYRCSADARLRRGQDVSLHWRLWLSDDGCWFAVPSPPWPPYGPLSKVRPWVARLESCIES